MYRIYFILHLNSPVKRQEIKFFLKPQVVGYRSLARPCRVGIGVASRDFQAFCNYLVRKRDDSNREMSQSLITNGAGEIVLTDKLSEDLATLYCSDKYSDVTFLVEDENKKIERIPCKVTADIGPKAP